MEKINLPKASKITSPNPVAIVCTQKPDGSTNLATVSWYTYLSYNPNMIAYAMAKSSYSGELVRENKKVVITIPSDNIKEIVMKCGMHSGRDTNKISKFEIEMQDIPTSNIKVPLHSAAAIQCKLKEYIETGDHYLYICDVEEVYADDKERAVFSWEGYSKIASAKEA
ncbi:flavin reductase family protein [Brachyspira innocens]|uniref:Flavin reductase family protein n=1 Tax=Brachyspira innocens TaxID=13264 RepID=A0ABT8Z1S1_9SPIR|nr:flavin reductase family protein [Brachyspira innocens]MDO6994788.1 flavin reductase family protein [Brachyspira innocens]MDO7021409.1 flavin reductase family protein [Brachyspira innocens]